MSDLIKRSDAIKALYKYSFVSKDVIEREIKAIPTADRPRGKVNAVKIYEQASHDLEFGHITLGEFEERTEPLKHLYYDRPQGEWIKDNLGTVICSECKRPRRDNRVNHINFCNSCGARMKGADDE